MTPKHFLDIASQSPEALRAILDEGHRVKAEGRIRTDRLRGKTLAMLFERPSTRTRFSFDLAMRELGGDTIVASGSEMQLGRGESLADTATVLSRYVSAVMIRMLDHGGLTTFAESAQVPVINGLTRRSHPCQIIADLITMEERIGALDGRVLAWVGDGNNVLATLMEAAPKLGFVIKVATPPEFAPRQPLVDTARRLGATIEVGTDPHVAVRGADVVVTDSWASMGDEDEEERRHVFRPYQVNEALMEEAGPSAIFMHCLPAHRGEEVTNAVMDGPQSVVFDEAENRVHAQKAILAYVFDRLG
ncbi:ornithine carbamoyltransferase [Acuticoccus sp. I52.16.1]|uniref:ornithine carbamoyltransferase n=1 Tax=Acuticoccus sp. I52.16.1 TaxID=2928472 RepID=UPI001FD15E85|nr:ornithine carbamoyltransferase [Acuticoccus sp. I52.16.1]UOM32763.1 ornithine carbamoyltransferase [Acuticoccus sp. I52.16.1]